MVSLSPTLLLRDVLYIPTFSFNLLSASSLTFTRNYNVNFFADSYEIQDLARGLRIGKGIRH